MVVIVFDVSVSGGKLVVACKSFMLSSIWCWLFTTAGVISQKLVECRVSWVAEVALRMMA